MAERTNDEHKSLVELRLATEVFTDTDGLRSVRVRTNEDAADIVLAAGFRRQGPITDEIVKAALDAYELAMQEHAKHGLALRAALEAAREAS